jgi:hypothetical protein
MLAVVGVRPSGTPPSARRGTRSLPRAWHRWRPGDRRDAIRGRNRASTAPGSGYGRLLEPGHRSSVIGHRRLRRLAVTGCRLPVTGSVSAMLVVSDHQSASGRSAVRHDHGPNLQTKSVCIRERAGTIIVAGRGAEFRSRRTAFLVAPPRVGVPPGAVWRWPPSPHTAQCPGSFSYLLPLTSYLLPLTSPAPRSSTLLTTSTCFADNGLSGDLGGPPTCPSRSSAALMPGTPKAATTSR